MIMTEKIGGIGVGGMDMINHFIPSQNLHLSVS